MPEYTDAQVAALNKAAEKFLSLYPLISRGNAPLELDGLEAFDRLDKILAGNVLTETDRSRKGRPAWHKARRLASAKTAEANWQQMRQKALQDVEGSGGLTD